MTDSHSPDLFYPPFLSARKVWLNTCANRLPPAGRSSAARYSSDSNLFLSLVFPAFSSLLIPPLIEDLTHQRHDSVPPCLEGASMKEFFFLSSRIPPFSSIIAVSPRAMIFESDPFRQRP